MAVFRLRAREKVFLGIEWAALELKAILGGGDDFFFQFRCRRLVCWGVCWGGGLAVASAQEN
jgi:hypothetical protein